MTLAFVITLASVALILLATSCLALKATPPKHSNRNAYRQFFTCIFALGILLGITALLLFADCQAL